MNILSLFANIGVAETYLDEIGFNVVVANEIDKKRAELYQYLYPDTYMICGDITEEKIQSDIIKASIDNNVDIIIATPPCQGMSTAGKKLNDDLRNNLIVYAINIIEKIMPKYVMLENVPSQLITKINVDAKKILIPEYLKKKLSRFYNFNVSTINTADYGVPQSRERAIFLLTRNDLDKNWGFPDKDEKVRTLYDAIGHLPSLDPLIYDISYEEHLGYFPNYEKKKKVALEYSKWHIPPKHILRQVIAMQHTPTGKSAFENDFYYPKNSEGSKIKGYKNTYKRQCWDIPSYTITMYNRTISSQNNVHPGRLFGKDKNGVDLYSDARVLTVYELILCMSLPDNWNIPANTSEHFIRSVIGEGIPPLFVKKLFMNLKEVSHD